MKVNTCFFDGNSHEYCTHQHYCIFNKKREILEKEIMKTWNKYNSLKKSRDSYMVGYYSDVTDYDYLLKRINLIKIKLSRLVKFRQKILDKEVEGYGILES